MTDVGLAQCNRRCFAFRNRGGLSKFRRFQPLKHVPSTRLQIRKSRRGYNRILDTVLYRISAYRQANPHPRQRELCRFPYLPLLQVSHSSIRESLGEKATLSQKHPPSRFRQDAAVARSDKSLCDALLKNRTPTTNAKITRCLLSRRGCDILFQRRFFPPLRLFRIGEGCRTFL